MLMKESRGQTMNVWIPFEREREREGKRVCVRACVFVCVRVCVCV